MRSRGRGVRGRFSPSEVAEIKALACELPTESGRPLPRWWSAELAKQAIEHGIVCSISGTTVWRYLAEDAIRPWAWPSWIFPRDPNFAEKAGRVLNLYERRWEGKLLHPGDYVISADEKSQLQALLGPPRAGRARSRPPRAGRVRVRGAPPTTNPRLSFRKRDVRRRAQEFWTRADA